MKIFKKVLRIKRRLPSLALLTSLAIGLLAISRAEAADFGVRVMDEHGQPLQDAAVCLGTTGKHDQFGVYMTGDNGVVVVKDLPAVELKVTVSRSGYQGIEMVEPVRSWNLIKGVTLLEDGLGPRCDTSALLEEEISNTSLAVRALYASDQGGQYLIESEIDGAPSHYRVSAKADFSDARWLPYSRSFTYSVGAAEALYYQVRRVAGNQTSWLEARSAVVTLQVN